MSYIMVKRLDVSRWTTMVIALRLHAENINSEGLIGIRIQPVSVDVENPSIDFVDSGTVTTYQFTSSAVTPGLVLLDLSSMDGAWLQISAVGTQASSPTTQTATMSADIILKGKR
jgi:hypothetical protein